jgi:predicted RNA-binding protein with PIN domain
MKKKGKGMGRPPKEIKQEKFIGYFVTHVQYFIIQEKAARAGVNISDYMRQMAIHGQVRARWTAEERELFKKMVGMSNDLSQLVRIAEREGADHAVLYLSQFRDGIDQALKRLSE